MQAAEGVVTEKSFLDKALSGSGLVVVACAIAAIIFGALHPDEPPRGLESSWEWALVMVFVVAAFAFWITAMLHAWRALEGKGGTRYLVLVLLFGGNIVAALLYWLFYAAWNRPAAARS